MIKLIKYLNKNKRYDDRDLHDSFTILSPIKLQIFVLTLSLGSTLFLAAGFVIFLDEQWPGSFNVDLNFFDSIYYVAVTGSTLGYGDIFPVKVFSKMSVIILIFITIYVFAYQISKIIGMLTVVDKYDISHKVSDHDVIFLYNDNLEILSSFLLKFLRTEHLTNNGNKRKMLLICHRDKGIDDRIKVYISLNIFEGRILYLPSKGTVNKRLIEAGCLTKAKTVYFLCNPASPKSENQDNFSMIYSHFLQNHNVVAKIYIQTISEQRDLRSTNKFELSQARVFRSIKNFTNPNSISIDFTENLEVVSCK